MAPITPSMWMPQHYILTESNDALINEVDKICIVQSYKTSSKWILCDRDTLDPGKVAYAQPKRLQMVYISDGDDPKVINLLSGTTHPPILITCAEFIKKFSF